MKSNSLPGYIREEARNEARRVAKSGNVQKDTSYGYVSSQNYVPTTPVTTDILESLKSHINNASNPHSVTYTQTGAEAVLGNPATDDFALFSKADGTRFWQSPFTKVTEGGTVAAFNLFGYGVAGTVGGCGMHFSSARGTSGSPEAVQTNDIFGGLDGRGYFSGAGGSDFPAIPSVAIQMVADENHTDTAHGGSINFQTTANGSVSRSIRWKINNNGDLLARGNHNIVPYSDGGSDIGTSSYAWRTGYFKNIKALSYYGGTAVPTDANIASGYFVAYIDHTNGKLKFRVNDGGTMKTGEVAIA